MLKYVLVAMVFLSRAACADSIDGDWCNDAAEHVMIDADTITLPTGENVLGQYRRHEFAYQVPAGKPQAGEIIYLQLQNEEEMTSYVVKAGKPTMPVQWHRCDEPPKSS